MRKLFAILLFIPIALSAQQVIDLTYSFDSNTVYWPTAEGFELTVDFEGFTDKGYYYSANKFCAAEHGGTHLDSPIHFYEGGQSVDQIPLENLMGKAIVVDVTEECSANRDHLISVNDLRAWEAKHGMIEEGTIVLLMSGFGKYWPHREEYMGTAERGIDAVAKLSFPGLSPEAAKWLTGQRNIKAVGIDTPSIDYGKSKYFKAHVELASHDVPIFENVANLDKLPAKGFKVIALPIKIANGSGGPARIIALVE